MVLPEDVQTSTAQRERLGRLALARHAQVKTWRFAPVVEALQAWRGVPCTGAVITVAALGDLTRFETPRQRMHDLGRTPLGICQWSAASAGQYDQDGPYPCPSCPGRRGLGLPVSGHRQASSPPALGKAPHSAPGPQGEGPRPALHTVPPPEDHRPTGPSGRGRHGSRIAGLSVGHCPAHGGDTAGRKPAAGCRHSAPRFSRLSAETPPRCGVTLGGVMRPTGTLVPRRRQAPDGGKEGGSQPTESSVLTRRVFLAPALPRDKGKNRRQM
jgi:hypothetical protein